MRSHLSTHKRLTISIALLGTIGVLASTTSVLAGTPGLPFGVSTACGCSAQGGELNDGGTVIKITMPGPLCSGNIKVENLGPEKVKILKEAITECTFKAKGCEGKELAAAAKCESEIQGTGTKPEYELEVEVNGVKASKKFLV